MGPADRLDAQDEPLIRCLPLLLLAACASLTEADCRSMDWYRRGYDDGYFGNPPQDIRLAGQCAAHGVRISESRYAEGWRAGHDEWDRLIGSYGQD
jgi:hypothetical protein